MSINLVKGQKVDITKGTSVSKILVGLGWDPAGTPVRTGYIKPEKKTFGSLLRDGIKKINGVVDEVLDSNAGRSFGNDIDCDAFVVCLDKNNKIIQDHDKVIFYGHLRNANGSIIHRGDNLTGAGEGDDEQIDVILRDIPASVNTLVFCVNIYNCLLRNQHFGMISNAFIRIEDKDTHKELCRFNLTEDYAYKTALIAGELYRHEGEWIFNALGYGTEDTSVEKVMEHIGKR